MPYSLAGTTVLYTEKNPSGYIMVGTIGAGTPPTTADTFGVGCKMVSLSTGVEYRNTGTVASPTWSTESGTDSVTSAEIADDSIVNADIKTTAGITVGKIALTTGSVILGASSVGSALDVKGDGKILVGDGTTAASVSVSGDATLANTGALTAAAPMKTDLVTLGLMGTVAAFGFPFNVTTDTEQTAALAKAEDGGVFINLASTTGAYTAAYQIWPDTELEDDACYFGGAAPFGVLTIDIVTGATYGADSVQWEYWDGAAWSALTIIYDETDTNNQSGTRPFMQDGQIIFSAPTDWASTTVDSQAAYWVRARIKTGFNVTVIPIMNSVEHKLVTSATASEMPAAGTISRGRISFVTASGANNDKKIILCNLTKGTASAIKTLTKALVVNEVADFAVTCAANDQIAIYVTQEDGTTEFANGIMELLVVKD